MRRESMENEEHFVANNMDSFHEKTNEKKELDLLGKLMGCFSPFNPFITQEQKVAQEDDWNLPFESLSNMEYLGAGAQGVVYCGTFRGELVAVKKLKESDTPETKFKHLRELNHDNIVRFKGACIEPPFNCVIMEYCQYGSLYNYLRKGVTISPKQVIKWSKEIAQGMAYLHEHKIIHRDLKSPNILIGDNLVMKVSDFGTSREWENGCSEIMSFTGTVAWMAPEVIKHEPCSDRIDVWSFGVVLWELLVQEIPYKNLGSHAIMWGVGSDTISLPIPSTCPESLRLLLTQCWSQVPRNRPPFKIIVAHLEVAGEEFSDMKQQSFIETQLSWKSEFYVSMSHQYKKSQPQIPVSESVCREELRKALRIRQLCEQQLSRANELYMEACTVKLQLEMRAGDLDEREKVMHNCKCGSLNRRLRKMYHRQASSTSSEGFRLAERRERGKSDKKKDQVEKDPKQVKVIVTLGDDGEAKFVQVVDEKPNALQPNPNESQANNNVDVFETIVECNGNVEIVESD